jgi:hypothetical protein
MGPEVALGSTIGASHGPRRALGGTGNAVSDNEHDPPSLTVTGAPFGGSAIGRAALLVFLFPRENAQCSQTTARCWASYGHVERTMAAVRALRFQCHRHPTIHASRSCNSARHCTNSP